MDSRSFKLKSLESRASKQKAISSEIDKELQVLNQRKSRESKLLTSILNEIKRLKGLDKELIVSEHALLRYLERIMGINLEDIKHEILNDKVASSIKMLGNGTYPVEEYKIVVKDGVVVTVLDKYNKK